jgi:hypothetical protein
MRSPPHKFQPGFITKTFFPEYLSDPSMINRGHCYDWAYVSYCLYPQVQLWSNKHHAFVQIGTRFFDSQTITLGRKSWENLEFFKNGVQDAPPVPMTLDQFKANWNTYGRYHRDKTMWQDMLARITQTGIVPIRT